ncbi:hypothetical protein PR202_gb27661 [Eleusine coracana subsp. coracana]|uniref:Berberine/berberine-like domain-containing protein n=1 Tax=Eleusine coracana subsp. coracana TaxID=191504 RepID=A0AAV5FV07_ELECO|nr:hypothetical protein PR202_gb27661 [Eleusine coracana subsp. coracana]
MAKMTKSLAPVLIFTFFSCYASIIVPSLAFPDAFRRCLSANNVPSQLVLTPSSPSFTPVLESSIRNPKFNTPTTVRPSYIVTPTNVSHVQAAVVCGRANGVRLPVRSGGHDYEGLSFRSYEAGKVWGEKYFKDNYQRLAVAKGQIDPDDYFRNEQSVPPLVRSQ